MQVGSSSSTKSNSASGLASNQVRLSGLMSGIDTESIVFASTSKTQAKIDKQMQNKQTMAWRQTAVRSVVDKMIAFQSKYLSYSATKSNNILGTNFFNVSKVTSSSSLVAISAASTAAKNAAASMKIGSIKQMATATQVKATAKLSGDAPALTTGVVQDEWRETDIIEANMRVAVGDSTYDLKIGDLSMYNPNDEVSAQNLCNELNKKIGRHSEIAGQVEFGYNADDKKFFLKKTDTNTLDPDTVIGVDMVKVKDKDGNLTTSDADKKLFEGMGFTPGIGSKGDTLLADKEANFSKFYNTTTVYEGSSVSFDYQGKSYTVKLEQDIDLSSDKGGEALRDALNDALEEQGLKGKVKFFSDSEGSTLSLQSLDNASEIEVTGGSIADNYGLTGKVGEDISGSSKGIGYKKSLGASLSGGSITVNFNSVSKTINFDASDIEQYNTPDKLVSYLQNKLTKAYGSVSYIDADGKTRDYLDADGNKLSKVSVSVNSNGGLSFKTNEVETDENGKAVLDADGKVQLKAANSSIFSITSSEGGVLGEVGPLRVSAGASNRVNTNTTLSELADKLGINSLDNGKYGMKINGTEITFDGNTTLTQMMDKINKSDAGVTISYSKTSDSFSIVCNDTGAQGRIDIEEANGSSSNMAEKLFGSNISDLVQRGQDAQLTVSFDNGVSFQTITRSSNSFELNDVNIELKGKTDSSVTNDNPISFNIETNTQELVDKIKEFIKDYNEIVDMIGGMTSQARARSEAGKYYDPLTDAQRDDMDKDEIEKWEEKAKQGVLRNNTTLTTLNSKLMQAMTSLNSSSAFKTLSGIGITTEAQKGKGYNKLVIDEDKLYKACANNPDEVATLFNDQKSGLAVNLKQVFTDYVGSYGTSGVLYDLAGSSSATIDTSNYGKTIDNINDVIKRLKTQLSGEQERLYRKFSAMEVALSRLNAQSSMLSQG